MATEGKLHISISAEPLFPVGKLVVTNSLLTSTIISGVLILFALAVRLNLTNTNRPTGLQNFAEWIVEFLWNLVQSITGSISRTKQFFPFIATFFLFILLNNWMGLLPGMGTIGFYHTAEGAREFVPFFRAGTSDLNMTLALALISVTLTQVFGILHLGFSYFKKFLNFSNPIMFFVGILEIISEFAKIISFAFRLFGNVFAGEVLLVVITFLVPIIAPMPFYGLEVFVGFIQALVFGILSLVFFNMASVAHEEH